MRLESIESSEFIGVALPALTSGGAEELGRRVAQRWTARQLCGLLKDEEAQTRQLACVALAIRGDERVVPPLTAALKDSDDNVSFLAEQALWAIWFRGGNPAANRYLRLGLESLKDDEPRRALACFIAARSEDPGYAEACNQCAIAHYLLEEWVESLEQCGKALELHRNHFGAMAGMGHSHFQLGNFSEASRWYQRSLAVNPGLKSAARALAKINLCISDVKG